METEVERLERKQAPSRVGYVAPDAEPVADSAADLPHATDEPVAEAAAVEDVG